MSRVIKIDYLSRIEGESGVYIEIKDGSVNVEMRVFEAPRFFESFLRGRPFQDAIDFTARICGICPVAYQMSSVHAFERIFGIEVDKPVRDLRRLVYCAEWISSHSLSVYILNGPDFYGLESAWSGKEYLPILKKGLFFKKLADEILTIIGGRPVHPVNVRVGGFFRAVDLDRLKGLIPSLLRAYEKSFNEIRRVSALKFQEIYHEREYVSLQDDVYPMNYGSIISNKGPNASMEEFLRTIEEYQRVYSTALHSGIRRDKDLQPYIVGPIARLNNNYMSLPDEIRGIIAESGIVIPVSGMDKGIIARVIEIAYALYESIRLINGLDDINVPSKGFEPCPGSATWITEAPRGILIHHYEIEDTGKILNCRIIPPTSQNLAVMEMDIRHLVEVNKHLDKTRLKGLISSLIRSYDPCISCSVHILN